MNVEFAPLLLEPAYRKVAAAIGERILTRALREGERLPPETELARQFGVNRSTIREALRDLESRGLVQRRPGSKLMSVSRPHHGAIAQGVSHALLLHDVTVRDLWEALTILEPPLAEAAARAASDTDLADIGTAVAAYAAIAPEQTAQIAQATAQVFRAIARATHNPVLGLAQEPLLQLLEPSLGVMIDKLPQARARIATAQRKLLEALSARDSATAHAWMARHIRDFRKGYELAGIDLERRVAPLPGTAEREVA
jgi:GntR family transcriptional regulator, transcriptional repressor for pyruvate dehydrogenase complex